MLPSSRHAAYMAGFVRSQRYTCLLTDNWQPEMQTTMQPLLTKPAPSCRLLVRSISPIVLVFNTSVDMICGGFHHRPYSCTWPSREHTRARYKPQPLAVAAGLLLQHNKVASATRSHHCMCTAAFITMHAAHNQERAVCRRIISTRSKPALPG
jgi:hypothetical protein